MELEHFENEVDDDGDLQSESLVEEVVRDVDREPFSVSVDLDFESMFILAKGIVGDPLHDNGGQVVLVASLVNVDLLDCIFKAGHELDLLPERSEFRDNGQDELVDSVSEGHWVEAESVGQLAFEQLVLRVEVGDDVDHELRVWEVVHVEAEVLASDAGVRAVSYLIEEHVHELLVAGGIEQWVVMDDVGAESFRLLIYEILEVAGLWSDDEVAHWIRERHIP